MSFLETAKEHPYLIGGAVLATVLLVMRGGGSSNPSSANIAASLQSQAIASDANVKLASIDAAATRARNETMGTIYSAAINASADLAKVDSLASVSAFTAFLGARENAATVSAQREVALASIAGNQAIATNKTANDLKMLTAKLGADSRVADLTFANMPALLQHSENLAKISGDTAVAITGMNTERATTVAEILSRGNQANNNLTNVSAFEKLLQALGIKPQPQQQQNKQQGSGKGPSAGGGGGGGVRGTQTPYDPNNPNAIDPETGLPNYALNWNSNIDPATGLPDYALNWNSQIDPATGLPNYAIDPDTGGAGGTWDFSGGGTSFNDSAGTDFGGSFEGFDFGGDFGGDSWEWGGGGGGFYESFAV